MPNYIEIVGCFYTNAEAYVPEGNDPTVYADLVWTTTPIPQAELDAQPPCPTGLETDLTNFFADLSGLQPGDTLTYDGTKFTVGPPTQQITVEGRLYEVAIESNTGAVGDEWLQSVDFPTNQTPIIIPFDCKLAALSFSNKDDGSKIDIEFYTVSESDGNSPSTLVYTWSLDTVRTARKTNFSPDVTFSQGDKLAIFARKITTNTRPSDVTMTMHFLITASAESESVDDWTGDIS